MTTYRIIPDPDFKDRLYFVNAVNEPDALLALVELNISVYPGRVIDTGVSPFGQHLIVTTKQRAQAAKELRQQQSTEQPNQAEKSSAESIDLNAYGKVQAAAILAGNAFIPEEEESVQDIRNLLRDTMRQQKVADQRVKDFEKQYHFVKRQSERAKQHVERVQEFLLLTLNDIAEKEARS